MIKYLINQLPAVRRLRTHLEESRALLNALTRKNDEIGRELDCSMAELDHVKKKRNDLHKQVDEMGATIIKQAATIDALTLVRNHAETLTHEQKLIIADMRSREERWHNTVQALNGSLNDRNAELSDLRVDLAAANEELEKRDRPVLFSRTPGMTDGEISGVLANKGGTREIKAVKELIDDCAVQAMSEAASAPAATITEGPHAGRGYTAEDRTFSAGGVFALTELKRRLEDALQQSEEREAA